MRSAAGNHRAIRNKGRIHFDPKFQRTCPRKMKLSGMGIGQKLDGKENLRYV
jgi:hypothetical protein